MTPVIWAFSDDVVITMLSRCRVRTRRDDDSIVSYLYQGIQLLHEAPDDPLGDAGAGAAGAGGLRL